MSKAHFLCLVAQPRYFQPFEVFVFQLLHFCYIFVTNQNIIDINPIILRIYTYF